MKPYHYHGGDQIVIQNSFKDYITYLPKRRLPR